MYNPQQLAMMQQLMLQQQQQNAMGGVNMGGNNQTALLAHQQQLMAQQQQQAQLRAQMMAMGGMNGMMMNPNPYANAMGNQTQMNQYTPPTINGSAISFNQQTTTAGNTGYMDQTPMAGEVYGSALNGVPDKIKHAMMSTKDKSAAGMVGGFPSWWQRVTGIHPTQLTNAIRQALTKYINDTMENYAWEIAKDFIKDGVIDRTFIEDIVNDAIRATQIVILKKYEDVPVKAIDIGVSIAYFGRLGVLLGGSRGAAFEPFARASGGQIASCYQRYMEILDNPDYYRQVIHNIDNRIAQMEAEHQQRQNQVKPEAAARQGLGHLDTFDLQSDHFVDPLTRVVGDSYEHQIAERRALLDKENEPKPQPKGTDPKDPWDTGLMNNINEPNPLLATPEVENPFGLDLSETGLYGDGKLVLGIDYGSSKKSYPSVTLEDGTVIEGLATIASMDMVERQLYNRATEQFIRHASQIKRVQDEKRQAEALRARMADPKPSAAVTTPEPAKVQIQPLPDETVTEWDFTQGKNEAAPAAAPASQLTNEEVLERAKSAAAAAYAAEMAKLQPANLMDDQPDPAWTPQPITASAKAAHEVAMANEQEAIRKEMYETKPMVNPLANRGPGVKLPDQQTTRNGSVLPTKAFENHNSPPVSYSFGSDFQGEALGSPQQTAPIAGPAASTTTLDQELANSRIAEIEADDEFSAMIAEQEALDEALHQEAVARCNEEAGNPKSMDDLLDMAKKRGHQVDEPTLRTDYLKMNAETRVALSKSLRLRPPAYLKRKHNLDLVSIGEDRKIELMEVTEVDYLRHETEYHHTNGNQHVDHGLALGYMRKSVDRSRTLESFLTELQKQLDEAANMTDADAIMVKMVSQNDIVMVEDIITNEGNNNEYQVEIVRELDDREVADIRYYLDEAIINYVRITTDRQIFSRSALLAIENARDQTLHGHIVAGIGDFIKHSEFSARTIANVRSAFTKHVNMKLGVVFAQGWSVNDASANVNELLNALLKHYSELSLEDIKRKLDYIYRDAMMTTLHLITIREVVDVGGQVGLMESITLVPFDYSDYPIAISDRNGFVDPLYYPELIKFLKTVRRDCSLIKLVTTDSVALTFTTNEKDEYYLVDVTG